MADDDSVLTAGSSSCTFLRVDALMLLAFLFFRTNPFFVLPSQFLEWLYSVFLFLFEFLSVIDI